MTPVESRDVGSNPTPTFKFFGEEYETRKHCK